MDRAEGDLTIRPEQATDRPEVSDVVTAAFGSPTEAQLVEAIRESPSFIPELSLVAEVGGRIVGFVMISYAAVHNDEDHYRIANLSPLAMHPGVPRRGIGSALVHAVSTRADARGEPAIVLEGNPAFYGRLGFEYSAAHGIHIPLPTWAPPEAAEILLLRNYDASIRGQVVYPAAFDSVNE